MLPEILIKIGLLLTLGGFTSLFFVNNPGRLIARVISVCTASLLVCGILSILYKGIMHIVYSPWKLIGIEFGVIMFLAIILTTGWKIVDWAFKNDGWN